MSTCIHPAINMTCYLSFDIITLSDVERRLDQTLKEDDFDAIAENVTPKTLTSCKTNALLKAFEVRRLILI